MTDEGGAGGSRPGTGARWLEERAAERMQHLLDAAPDATIVVDAAGTIVFANRQTERLFGHAPAALVGRTVEALVPGRLRALHEGHRAGFTTAPRSRPMGSGIDLVGLREDGSEFPIEISLSPFVDDGRSLIAAVVRDISARKRTEAAAKTAADRLFDALESIDDAFAIFDADHRLVIYNSAYRSLFGEVLQGPIVGRPAPELVEAWARACGLAGAARAEYVSRHVARFAEARALDEYELCGRTYQVTIRRTREGGAVTVIMDRTEDKRREQALREASAAKSEFLSSMSHELRTPLNAILGFAQLLQRDRRTPLTERHLARVEHIVRGGEHLLHLIDEILDLARIEAGKVPVSLEPIELAGVVEHVIATLAPMAGRNEITLVGPTGLAELPQVLADRTRYAQILMNFGSNAIKYGRPGGAVTFAASLPAPGRVRVAVVDDGIGIAPEHQPKIFQPFYRAGQETGPIEGTGIGLALSKQLAELMHGTVGFRSELGEGSEFWVELPAASQAIAARAPPAPPAASPLTGAGRVFRVVYVEDHPANIAFMEELLADFAQIELITAPTAEIGVELVRTHRPDVVILDINLPGMSGLDAIRLLRSWPETRDIPVIGLSAAAMERDAQRALAAGFHRYLTKPVKVDELVAALEELLLGTPSGA